MWQQTHTISSFASDLGEIVQIVYCSNNELICIKLNPSKCNLINWNEKAMEVYANIVVFENSTMREPQKKALMGLHGKFMRKRSEPLLLISNHSLPKCFIFYRRQ